MTQQNLFAEKALKKLQIEAEHLLVRMKIAYIRQHGMRMSAEALHDAKITVAQTLYTKYKKTGVPI